jgi:hypothetical protein
VLQQTWKFRISIDTKNNLKNHNFLLPQPVNGTNKINIVIIMFNSKSLNTTIPRLEANLGRHLFTSAEHYNGIYTPGM